MQQFSSIRAKYPSPYSTHKHHVGLFTGWKAKAKIDPAINCRQKQRGCFLPATAKEDLDKYFKSGVFVQSTGGADSHVCNITLTRRPQQKEQKFSTKADKNLQKKEEKKKIYDVNNSRIEESNEDRVLYRLTIDMRAVNTATQNDTSIVLPTIETIERSFHSSIISTFDISNQFYNVAVHEDSMKYFNFYVENQIWTHGRLPQGWCGSPKVASEVMQ